MSSPDLIGTLFALAVSCLLNLWFFVNLKAHAVNLSESQTSIPVTLPKGWWSNPDRFEAERRAIFSQTWMCVSHRGRFKTPGDYIVYEIAGFRFFMILGKDKIVRSFHNVCRHRAFPVAKKQYGSATTLGCRYHGWSYDTTGRLTKAPIFEDKPGFDKSQNSLFEIYTREDRLGFLHINPGTDAKVAKSFPTEGITTGKLARITPGVKQLSSFELEGAFNWKIIVDDFASTAASTLATGLAKCFPMLFPTPEAKLDFYPLTTVHTASGSPFWYQLTYNPISATKTALRCYVYSIKNSENFLFEQSDRRNLEQAMKKKIQGLEAEHKKVTSFGYDSASAYHKD
ncbi:hypothetical protein NW762_007180 [Fusarium torreyae]|uniref:Rieske domain-containing protein n=1 Tax=Fusarium torreyae TaxID=1237075 RepID=A0A9W8VEA9_9HYPO|nr:hypothetical protein NW762_007180 [Fusarium torreyae]